MIQILGFLLLIFILNDASSQECRPYSTNEPCDPDKIKCYCGGEEIVYDYEKNNITKKSSKYVSREMTTMILHGIDQNKDDKYIQALVSSYEKAYNSKGHELNVLVCDFSKLVNKKCYEISEGNLDYIGSCLAKFIYSLKHRVLHMVGYDIGASLMTTFARHYPDEIRRTTSLDQDGSFYGKPNTSLISAPGISTYRDCIHTNGNKYAEKCGTVDFFVNLKDEVQPGCPDNPEKRMESEECSHLRSLLYFNESINNPDAFWGYKCEFVHPNRERNCEIRPPYQRMGERMEGQATGIYEVDTNAQYPFGQGKPKTGGAATTTRPTTTTKPTTTTMKPATTTMMQTTTTIMPTTTTMKAATTTIMLTTTTMMSTTMMMPTATTMMPTTTMMMPTTTMMMPTTTTKKPTTITTKPTKLSTTTAKPEMGLIFFISKTIYYLNYNYQTWYSENAKIDNDDYEADNDNEADYDDYEADNNNDEAHDNNQKPDYDDYEADNNNDEANNNNEAHNDDYVADNNNDEADYDDYEADYDDYEADYDDYDADNYNEAENDD